MFEVIAKLLMTGQLKMEKGLISLLGNPVVITPVEIFVAIQKALEEELGPAKASEVIYKAVKEGSIPYNKKIMKAFKMHGQELIKWQVDSINLAGWGTVNVVSYKPETGELIARVDNSPFAEAYGKSRFPVDNIVAAFPAAKMTIDLGRDIDCVETKCVSRGDPICEFITGEPKKIAALKKKLWKEWLKK